VFERKDGEQEEEDCQDRAIIEQIKRGIGLFPLV
jgi:hypothetical protein